MMSNPLPNIKCLAHWPLGCWPHDFPTDFQYLDLGGPGAGGILHFLFTQISTWPLMQEEEAITGLLELFSLPSPASLDSDPKDHMRRNYSALPKQALQPHAYSRQACPEPALLLFLQLTLISGSLWPTCHLSTFLLRCVTLPWGVDMIRIQIITSLTSKLLPLLIMRFKITLTFLFSSPLHM